MQGTVTIEASTTDDTKVAKVEFYIDGTKVGEDTDGAPYQYNWDTSGLENNSTHTIQAKAYDTTSNMGESDVITVIVRNNRLEVTIVNPTDGDTVQGMVIIEASVEADNEVAKVEFYIDGTKVGEDNDSPYQYNWDTSGLENNSTHTIQAKAYDTAGNMGENGVITVIVRNPIPQITILSPKNRETVQGTVTIVAEAHDDEGISQVDFFINDTLWESFTSEPYEYDWDTYKVIDGIYTIKAEVTDSSENSNSASIDVTVNNGQKTFGGSSEDAAYSIQQTSDDGYIVAGWTKSSGAGGYDAYVLKLLPNGDLGWQKTFGGSGWDEAYSIQQTTDGGYVVAGYTYSFASSYDHDVYVLKLDSNGDLHPFQ